MKSLTALALLLSGCVATKNTGNNYDGYISKDFLKEHLTVIAGPAMEGRNTPSAGLDRAAVYIAGQYKAWGLNAPADLKDYRQYYPLYMDSVSNASLSINGVAAVLNRDFAVPTGNNAAGNVSSEEVVFVGYGVKDENYNDYSGLDVKNKIVIISIGEPVVDGKYVVSGKPSATPGNWDRLTRKLMTAKDQGAKAVLIINPAQAVFTPNYLKNLQTASATLTPETMPGQSIPYAVISKEYAQKVFGDLANTMVLKANLTKPYDPTDYLAKVGRAVLNVAITKSTANASNVVAVVEGSDKKNEYVVLSAHYDHLGMRDGKIYNGADDDGSGTVAVMAMAKAFAEAKKAGHGPRRTMIFLNVSGEEKGLWGSKYYSEHPVYPLGKTSADLNIDMIGRIDTERKTADTLNYVYVVGHDKLSSELNGICVAANEKTTKLVLDYRFDDPKDPNRIYFRSDHFNFAKSGVPAMFFYDGMLKGDYHKEGDTVDKIYWDVYQKRVLLVYHMAWELANREKMLVRDIPLPKLVR